MPPVTQARLCRSGFEGDRRRQVPGRARLPKAGADGAQTPQLRPGDVTVMGEHSCVVGGTSPPRKSGRQQVTEHLLNPYPCPSQPGVAHTRGQLSTHLGSAHWPTSASGLQDKLSLFLSTVHRTSDGSHACSLCQHFSLLWAKYLQSLQPPRRKLSPGSCSSLLPLRGPDFTRSGFPSSSPILLVRQCLITFFPGESLEKHSNVFKTFMPFVP